MCGGGGPDMENTEAQKSLAEVAAKKWNDYQTMFVPMENKFIENVQGMNSKKAMDESTNVAGVTSNKVTTQAINENAKAMVESGVNPNSTKFKKGMDNVSQSAGVSASNTKNKVQTSQQDRFIQGLDSVNAMGQGKEASAISGMGDVAQMSNESAISDYQNEAHSNQGANQILGAGVGAATRAGMG